MDGPVALTGFKEPRGNDATAPDERYHRVGRDEREKEKKSVAQKAKKTLEASCLGLLNAGCKLCLSGM